MKQRMDYSAANCSVAAALSVVGEKWTLLVLREAFYGIKRFDEMQKVLGCARNVLSDRLATLVEAGILERSHYREHGQRERPEYHLSKKGSDLFVVLLALMQWGDQWLAKDGEPPVAVLHNGCGLAVFAEMRCADGHGPLTAKDIYAKPGPAAILNRRNDEVIGTVEGPRGDA